MKDHIKEYTLAFEAHHQAMKDKIRSNLRVKQTHYALLKAREAMREKERELIEETEREALIS